jgi:DNA-binding CsgD family transcriptional regulator
MLDSALYHFDMRDKKITEANQMRVSQMHHANSNVEAIASVQLEKAIATFEKNVFVRLVTNATILLLSSGALVFLVVRLQRYYQRNKSVRTLSNTLEGELEEHQGAIGILIEEVKTLTEERQALELYEAKLKTSGFISDEAGAELLKNEISQAKLVTENAWIDFKNQFTTAYPNFLENLIISQPRISTGEQRMACMLRLNMTAKEIADITCVSYDSVKRSLLRFKKKLGFSTHEELLTFIFSMPV